MRDVHACVVSTEKPTTPWLFEVTVAAEPGLAVATSTLSWASPVITYHCAKCRCRFVSCRQTETHTRLLQTAAAAQPGLGSGQLGLDAGHAARLPGSGLACPAAPAQAVRLVAVAVELAGRLLLLALAAHLRKQTPCQSSAGPT